MNSVVLFLDFDGVLHPSGGNASAEHFSRLPMFENLLREPVHQDLRIVVSSTWREIYPVERLRSFFSPDLRARVIGSTPVLDDYDSDYGRFEEIRSWLSKHPGVSRWAALDDDIEGFPPHQRKCVVFTDPAVGLTDQTLAELRQLLA